MEELQQYFDNVEAALGLAGIDPVLSRSETEGQWNLKKDELEVWIDVLHIPENKRTYLQVMAPMMLVPAGSKEEFLSELLELNYQMIDAAFCVFDNSCYIKIMREIEHLGAPEILLAINRVGYYASVNEKGLIEKFNAEKIKLQD
jgi:hypothetical protein